MALNASSPEKTPRNGTGAVSLRDLAGPALIAFSVAAGTLLLQLVQTRIYGLVFWNHLVYFIISIALLGFGISGTWLAFGDASRVVRGLTMRRAAVGFVATAVLSSFVMPRLGLSIAQVFHSASQLAQLLMTYVAAVLPYFFAGWILGTLYRDRAKHIHTLYFADLLGAAGGCLSYLGLFPLLGPVGAVAICCALVGVSVLAFTPSKTPKWRSLAALASLLALLAGLRGVIERGMTPEPTKGFVAHYADLPPGDEKRVEFSEWNTICRTDVLTRKLHPEDKRIYLDGDAWTRLKVDPPWPAPPFDPAVDPLVRSRSPYYVRSNPESVLVIGAGGGSDVLAALRGGAKRIDAVEINPTTARIMLDEYRDVSNDLFHRPGVRLLTEEGRSFVRRSGQRYDLIVINAIDTYAALNAGAYMLSENYLYTVEAVKDYLEHLTDRGILVITRWDHEAEAPRLFNVMLEALYELGYAEPNRHIVAHARDFWVAVLVSPGPFSDEETQRLKTYEQGLGATFYFPLPPAERAQGSQTLFNEYAEARSDHTQATILDECFYDISPVHDDSPFFFHYEKARHMLQVLREEGPINYMRGHWPSFTLTALLVILAIAVGLFMFLPLLRHGRADLPRFPLWLAYFGCLGVSFIFVEISMMQRFALLLGHPSRSLALVLGSLLFFAGVGSYVRARWRVPLRAALVALVCAILVAAFAYPVLINAALGLPLWLRGLVTVALVGPVAAIMGMPFPTGIRAVSEYSRQAVPWMWGVNGGATVLGSILAIVVAIHAGFTTVLAVAALGYALAFVLYGRATAATA